MNDLKTYFRKFKTMTLETERKARMRAELSSYADLHTLPDAVPARPVASPFAGLLAHSRNLYAGALVAILFVAGGTQASLAAEGALPGDVLYPIKVALNEPLALSLSFTPERKAELAARFASRRLDEAAELSAKGELDAQEADELAARFDAHVDTLAKETGELESKGALGASLAVRTDLEQRLSTQVEDFTASEVRGSADASATVMADEAPADRFAARVFEKSKTLATTREKLETALDLDLKAETGGAVDVRTLGRGQTTQGANEAFVATVAAELGISATAKATSTASSTKEKEEEKETRAAFPTERFFAPFLR